MFVTTAEFLPQHHAQRHATLQLITAAEAAGHARVAEMNKQVAANLDKIIAVLQAGSQGRKQPPMRPDPPAPLAAAAARRHQLTRARAIQALRELDRAGAAVTFAAVAAAAGISRSWLYTQPDIRDQIQQLRTSSSRTARHPGPRQPAATDASQRARLTAALQRNQATRRRERPAPPPARPSPRRPAHHPDPIR